jgi:hypothetical protein
MRRLTTSFRSFRIGKKSIASRKGTWQPVPLEKEPEDYEELVEAEEEAEGDDGDDEIWWTLACPVSKCDGSVFFSEDGVQEGKYWACDSCDSSWFDTKNLVKEIAAIIKKFPYRKKLYRKTDDGYEPVDWEGDIMDYCDLVEKEPRDKTAGKKRG